MLQAASPAPGSGHKPCLSSEACKASGGGAHGEILGRHPLPRGIKIHLLLDASSPWPLCSLEPALSPDVVAAIVHGSCHTVGSGGVCSCAYVCLMFFLAMVCPAVLHHVAVISLS